MIAFYEVRITKQCIARRVGTKTMTKNRVGFKRISKQKGENLSRYKDKGCPVRWEQVFFHF